MKLKYIFLFSATLLVGTSCSDFLDKEPISDNVDGNFFTAETSWSLIATTCMAYCPITAQVRVLSDTSLQTTTVMT